MKRFLIIVLIGGLLVTVACAQRSLIRNGSFEADGVSIPDISVTPPMYWCDVNIPTDQFVGYTNTSWSSQGGNSVDGNSVTIQCIVFSEYVSGDMATLSTNVTIEPDVNQLTYSLRLTSDSADWDPEAFSAIVLIDGVKIWDSEVLDINSGEVFEKTIVIEADSFGQWADGSEHILSLGIESKDDIGFLFTEYMARWDFVKFDKYCGGLGFLDFDFNQDCYVNMGDFAILANVWMEDANIAREDIFEDGVINGLDMAMLAEDWLFNTDWKFWGQDGTFEMERLSNDWDMSGRIDVGEIIVLSEYWLSDGRCAGVEMAGDETIINFEDFAALVGQWGLTDWLYYYVD